MEDLYVIEAALRYLVADDIPENLGQAAANYVQRHGFVATFAPHFPPNGMRALKRILM